MNRNELLDQFQELNQIPTRRNVQHKHKSSLLSACQRVDWATINKSTTSAMITLAQEKVAILYNEREEKENINIE
jgi:hypothetical protein